MASFAGAAAADCTAIMMVCPIIRMGAVQHPRAKLAEQITPCPTLCRSGQWMGGNQPAIRKPKEMLTRAGEILGRDARVHEVFRLYPLGAGYLLRGGFITIQLRL
jgi:hypothetical protein